MTSDSPHSLKRETTSSQAECRQTFIPCEAYASSRYTLELELQRREVEEEKPLHPGRELVVSLTWYYYFDTVLAKTPSLKSANFPFRFPFSFRWAMACKQHTLLYVSVCVGTIFVSFSVEGEAKRIFFLAIFVEAISSLARRAREREYGTCVVHNVCADST